MTHLSEITVSSRHHCDWINISAEVKKAVTASGVREGLCVVFIPHTTAAVTVNENADPDVPHDIGFALDRIAPHRGEFRHSEGNSDAHTKTTLIGPSVTLIVAGGKLLLGTWQGVWFNEYDGPRNRRVYIRVLGE